MQVTCQVVLTSDGRVSFAAFIYDEDSIDNIHNIWANKLVGFDAGDEIRSATYHSPGLSNLQTVNYFRIDGVL